MLTFGSNLYSIENQIEKADNYLDEKSEVYLSISKEQLSNELLHILSVDYFDDDIVFVYANKRSFTALTEKGISFNVEKHPGEVDFCLNMKCIDGLSDPDTRNNWDYYPTYDAYVDMMYQFEEDFPEMVEIYNIGSTVMGRDMLFARITSDIILEEPKPMFMYTSTMHGDETAGFVFMLRLIDHFLNNYGVLDEITDILDNMEIWISPNENPDGTYTNDNSSVYGATRGNANGIDLNRNYPNPVSSHSSQEQETLAMMHFVSDKNFVMSANIHGGIELVNYPFDSWTSSAKKHADHDWFYFVSREYADTAQYYSPAGYMTAYGGVTHGGDWYVVYGSRQDYMNYYRSTREVTLELSNEKLLEPTLLPTYWDYNYRSLINYIKQANYGIQGVVTDIETGEPVPARLTVVGHDSNNSEVYACSAYGFFARPIKAGVYNLRFSMEGYDSATISDVSIQDYESTWLEVEMQAWPVSIYETDTAFDIVVAPNPVDNNSSVIIKGAEGFMLNLYLFNIAGDLLEKLYSGSVSTDNKSIELSGFYTKATPGVYFIKADTNIGSKVVKVLVF